MKVGLVTTLYGSGWGGAEAVVKMLAEQLIRKGIEVFIITTKKHRSAAASMAGGITHYEIAPNNLYWIGDKDRQAVWKKALWQMWDTWNAFSYFQVRDILSKERPDVLHVHKLRGISPSVWQAARTAGVKRIVQTCHDYELMSPEGTLTGKLGDWAREQKWFLRPYQGIRAHASRSVDVVTAPSAFTLGQIQQVGFFPGSVRTVIPNSHGYPLDELKGLEAQKKTAARKEWSVSNILFIGRLERNKGVEFLCQGFLAAKGSNEMTLNVVGAGSCEDELRSRYGGHRNIVFHGSLHGEKKKDMFLRSDVLVVPSVWPEVFGIVIVEAMAYGIPVIGTRVGGVPEIVNDDLNGYLVRSGSSDDIRDAIEKMRADEPAYERMQTRCFTEAPKYSLDMMTDRYVSCYTR